MPSPTSFRLLGSVQLVGFILVIFGMVARIQSVPTRAEDGVDLTASVSGKMTNLGDEPALLTIEGTVVDEGGDPVPKTRVRLYNHHLVGEVATALADAEGRFRFSTTLATMRYLVFVADSLKDGKQAYADIFEEGTLGLPAPLKLVLKPPQVLDAEVLDSRGEPIVDAHVEVLALMSTIAHGRTERDGKLRFTLPMDAKVESVFALKSGLGFDYWTHRTTPDGQVQELPEKLSLTLEGARCVRVRAVDDAGDPVSGISVGPWTIMKPGRSSYINLASGTSSHFGTAVTDAKGLATFEWLPIDFKNSIEFLTFSKDLYLAERPSVEENTEDDVELTMNLLRKTKMSGTVLASDGTPAAGIIVQAEGRGQSSYFRDLARTNAAGRFQFSAYPNQAYLVAVLDNDWGATSQTIPKLMEGQPVTGIELHLGPGTLVRGMVTDEEGRGRSDVTVGLTQSAQVPGPDPLTVGLVRWAKTDREGRYQFRLGSGNFELRGPGKKQRVSLKIEAETEVFQDFRVE